MPETPVIKSQFRGVGWNKQHKKWVAWMYQAGKKTHLGVFKTELEAAKAYDDRAKKALGDKAQLNFK